MGQVQSNYAMAAIFFLGLTGVAWTGDWLQARRRKANPERIGLIPWPLILTLSLLLAAVFAAFWLKEG
jgi:hypothetical protein